MIVRRTDRHRQGLTLEIGGGHNPSPLADVVVDKYLLDDTERSGVLDLSRPLVIADGQQLPFRQGVFARTVARQVMEHVEDIEAFFQELMRVSDSGYLAAPTVIRERLFGWPYHRWVFVLEGETLVCALNSDERDWRGELNHHFAATNRHFRRFLRSLPVGYLHIQYEWQGEIIYRVEADIDVPKWVQLNPVTGQHGRAVSNGPRSKVKELVLRVTPPSLLTAVQTLETSLHSTRRRRLSPDDLEALLVCPACHGDLARSPGSFLCTGCDREYPVRMGIPVMLVDSK